MFECNAGIPLRQLKFSDERLNFNRNVQQPCKDFRPLKYQSTLTNPFVCVLLLTVKNLREKKSNVRFFFLRE